MTIGYKVYKFSDIFVEEKSLQASESCAGKTCIVNCSCNKGWSSTKPTDTLYREATTVRTYADVGSINQPQSKTCYIKLTCEAMGYYSEKPQYYPDCSSTYVREIGKFCYFDCYGYFYLHRTNYTNLELRKESAFKDYPRATTCGANQVLVGRDHNGDENGGSRLRCGTFHVHPTENTSYGDCYSGMSNMTVTVEGRFWTDWRKESGNVFHSPSSHTITGREHGGDENGATRYEVGLIYVSNGKHKASITHYDMATTPVCRESRCGWVGVNGAYMMTGRSHWGDENGDTQYTSYKARVYLKYE